VVDCKFICDKEKRVDVFLQEKINASRSQILNIIKRGGVFINGAVIKKGGQKVKIGDIIEIKIFRQLQKREFKKSNFKIEVIFEDEDILVINKPYGVTVHPAKSVKEPTLVDWLKENGYTLSDLGGKEREGIVHRLDKTTSGVMAVAKNNKAHNFLSLQLQNRLMGRYYLAVIDLPLKENCIVSKPIGRNPKNRLKMGIVKNGRESKTAFCKIETSMSKKWELIGVKLFTGRTHQIRVHLNSISRHILGDSLYGFKSKYDTIGHIFLHAYIMYLIHPKTKSRLLFKANLPKEFDELIKNYFEEEKINEKIKIYTFLDFFNDIDNWMCKTACKSS
jgi:23S rRNA pseudouridine1911/1915/1917 synthase